MNAKLWLGSLLFLALVGGALRADTFGSGANSFSIDFVPISGPTILAPYDFSIAKYEISEQMIDKANALGGLGITKDTRGPDKPATSITWFEAAKFVNWLNTSSGQTPAYKFDSAGAFQLWETTDPGYNPSNLFRNTQARYVLPSIDEWRKAAYYDPNLQVFYLYPTGSNSVPDGIDFVGDPNFDAVFDDGANQLGPNEITNVGIVSPSGTFGQGGNVLEWTETEFGRANNMTNEQRYIPGGSWGSLVGGLHQTNLGAFSPSFAATSFGFRIAAIVPEPNSCALMLLALFIITKVRVAVLQANIP